MSGGIWLASNGGIMPLMKQFPPNGARDERRRIGSRSHENPA